MVPSDYHDFLIGGSEASAALIGLLFVAVSVAPDRVFGADSSPLKHAQALSAFTALANAFFTSLAGLIPDVNMGVVALTASALSLAQTAAMLFLWQRWKKQEGLARGVFLLVVSTMIYAAELFGGLRYLHKITDEGSLSILFICILAMFFIGLSRAWELMGARENPGLVTEIRKRIIRTEDR